MTRGFYFHFYFFTKLTTATPITRIRMMFRAMAFIEMAKAVPMKAVTQPAVMAEMAIFLL